MSHDILIFRVIIINKTVLGIFVTFTEKENSENFNGLFLGITQKKKKKKKKAH